MKRETVIFTLISIATVLSIFILLSSFVTRKENKNLGSKIAEQQKELSAKDLRIKDLMSANQTLDALVRQQNKLIEGEPLEEFMEMYDENRTALSVEILVYLKDSETGLPRRFLIEGSSIEDNEEEQ